MERGRVDNDTLFFRCYLAVERERDVLNLANGGRFIRAGSSNQQKRTSLQSYLEINLSSLYLVSERDSELECQMVGGWRLLLH